MKTVPLLMIGALLATQALVATSREGAGQTVEQRIDLLERRFRALSDLVLRLDSLQREVQQLRGEVEVQSHALDAMKLHQRELYLDIDSRLTQGATSEAPQGSDGSAAAHSQAPDAESSAPEVPPVTAAPTVDPAVPPLTAAPGEEEAYQRSFELLTQRRYDEARSAFQGFLKKYPGGLYADNAQYWLGEASYVTREFDTSLEEFNKVLRLYPKSTKVAAAMLKIGYIQYDRQQRDKARETLDRLIQGYPDSSAARLAQEFIRRKGL